MTRETRYADAIALALATPGGHLSIGPAGCTLHWAEPASTIPVPPSGADPGYTITARPTSRLSGAPTAELKALCAAAGLPVLDCSAVPFEVAWQLIASGPLVAVACEPTPPPWGPLSHAPLAHVAALYRAAGAEVLNIPDTTPAA